jgi:hypothetical protein
MTAEEKRELLLKRALPGLAVIVLYFVFVSSMMAEKMKKAETDYKNLMMSGVSKEALPSISSQQAQTQQQLTEVQKKVTELQTQFKKMAGFLSNSDNSTNATMAKVSRIFDDFQIKQSKDEKAVFSEAQLNPSLKEVWQAIKPTEAEGKKTPDNKPVAVKKPEDSMISVHHLWLKGSYTNMYQALTAIAAPTLQVLPISLTMLMPEVDVDNSGEMEWELILWM